MAATLRLEPPSVTAVPGGVAIATAVVVNEGDGVEDLALRVEGDPAGWAALEPRSVVLFPGAEALVTITFSVPEGPGAAPGPLPYVVRAEGAGADVEARGALEVAPYAEVVLQLRPPVLPGRRPRGTVVLENRGNAPAELHLAGRSASATVAVEPSSVVVPAGESVVASVRVDVDRAARGAGGRSTFTVAAEGREHPRLEAAGEVAPAGRSRSGALAAVVAALALAASVPLLWIGVARPLIRDEARTAAATEGAAAQRAGTPIDGRLFLDGSGQTSYTVPEGRTLQVTDVIVQNPAGDAGVLRIRRGDQVLIELGLENFRTQDVHFVTPISFPDGQRLVLEATCVAQAGGPTACTPSALFSGVLL